MSAERERGIGANEEGKGPITVGGWEEGLVEREFERLQVTAPQPRRGRLVRKASRKQD